MNPLGAALVLAIPPTKSRADDHSKGGSKRTPAAKLEIMTHFKEGDEIVLKSSTRTTGCTWNTNAGSIEQNL